jgi:proteic killer suppression protein
MIQSFCHRGLERYFRTGNSSGISPAWIKRLQVRLDALNAAAVLAELDLPGWQLHELRGARDGVWSIRVTGNWRLTFRFEDGDAREVDLQDYH